MQIVDSERINVTRSSMPDLEEYVAEIKEMWDTHWLTNMGVKHRQLQAQLKEYLSVENIDLFTNGHMSLELSLQAMGVSGEVITTPFTFASTTHAIVRCGCTPVFCDINPTDYTIDVTKIEALITDKTTAIVPVHVYGNICDVEEIERIAKKHNLKVIYDAAHAFGISYKGRGIGSFGDASCFSFHATKVFNTIEGGAVCFKDEVFGGRLFDLKNFGIHGENKVDGIGANAKMNEFCAAMGICNLRHIDAEIAKRAKVEERYRKNLSGISGITLNIIQENITHNHAYFPILVDEKAFGADRDRICQSLAEQNIKARKYFYPITSAFECYKGRFEPNKTPVAQDISQRILSLPIYADLSLETVDKICEIILKNRAN